MKALPSHGFCYVCGKENPKGLGVKWYVKDDGTVFAQIVFELSQQGPPGHAHGGASASLLDEAMGTAVWMAGHKAVAVNLNVDFKLPLPLDITVQVIGKVAGKSGRKVLTCGELRLPDGSVAVKATGVFVEARHMFPNAGEESKGYPSTGG